MNRLVMIADIADSRQLESRAAIQGELEETLRTLNRSRKNLLSPYTVTLGDEFQAVFSSADRIFPDLFHVLSTLHPVGLRCALALGPLATEINRKQAIGMDGPAFHRARDLLQRMKKGKPGLGVAGLPEDDGLLEGTLGLLNHEIRKWRSNRLEILRLLLLQHEIPDIADRLDITEQSVYKNIREGSLNAVTEVLQALTSRMNAALTQHE